jgi:hypothetical protein
MPVSKKRSTHITRWPLEICVCELRPFLPDNQQPHMYRTIDRIRYIDLEASFHGIIGVSAKERLAVLLKLSGVSFHDRECSMVAVPTVGICGI